MGREPAVLASISDKLPGTGRNLLKTFLRNFFWNHRVKIISLFAASAIFVIWLAFPQPDYSIWPPKEMNDRHIVYVTVDGYHSCINFPDIETGMYQEWHMGAKEWYLGDKSNFAEVVAKATAGKVPAVIKFGLNSHTYWERKGLPKEQVFTFWLSPKGFKQLNNELHRSRGSEIKRVGDFWYFPYKRGYHLIENCNDFIARALIAGGLPIREILAQEGRSMTFQLKRCVRIQSAAFSEMPASWKKSENAAEGSILNKESK